MHKAGQPFTITVTGYNALSALATNYDGSPAANVVGCTLPTIACSIGVLSPGVFAGGGGIMASTTATYSEVGVIQVQASDDTFAAVDAGDGSSVAERTAYSPITVTGRFVPDHFTLTSGSVTAACVAGAPAFTYMNQPFQNLTVNIQAENAAGTVTVNYHSPGFPANLAAVAWQAENADNGVDLSARFDIDLSTPLIEPPSTLWGGGVHSASTTMAGFRRAAPDNPDGPFDSLRLGVRLTDPDAVALNALDMNPTTAGACAPCTAKMVGASNNVRFGRLHMLNAHGSELRALPLTVRSKFWNGSGFAQNTADNCTSLAVGDFSYSNWQLSLNPGDTAVVAPGPWSAVAGVINNPLNILRLSVPGVGNQGAVDVTVATPVWLLGNWDGVDQLGDGALYDDNAAARATFGVYRDRLIFRREITR